MSGQLNETEQAYLLEMVETAQRAGHSEDEIAEIVETAVVADADLRHAA